MTEPVAINSPCVNICVINAETGWCLGCYRTVEEISGWQSLSRADRVRIIDQLERRRQSQDKNA